MRKITILSIIALCIVVSAGFAIATLNGTIGQSGPSGNLTVGDLGASYTFVDPNNNPTTLTFTPSTQVLVGINSEGSNYAINAKHYNGDREFGAASDATSLFWNSSTAGTVLEAAPTASNASAFSGWNSL